MSGLRVFAPLWFKISGFGCPLNIAIENEPRRHPEAPHGWKQVAGFILGWLLILVGIVGLFLPILQGVLMIAAGLMLLEHNWPWLAHKLDHWAERHPKFEKTLSKLRQARGKKAKRQAESGTSEATGPKTTQS